MKREQDTEVVTVRTFASSPRRALYAASWILLFCIAAAELGLISQQLHNGGNSYEGYANKMFKHILGLLLFSVILVFLMCIGHFFAGPIMMAFWVLTAATSWGVGAGVTWQSSPYRHYNCHDEDPNVTFSGTRWAEQQFFSQCSRIVTIQGLAWAEWGLLVMMFFGMLYHIFEIKTRPNLSFYGA
ncbi:hypothetical protein D9615_009471 [Tricholomella constricta]|uniref:MARVEL domain-containing protein n=1 Tax=Tricholomella constricta TaxID=117010 RepID=A0A8H5LXW7_9AGAR|nr:hypothetical protein D9615_009471 [Tricholomella constricta]